MVPSLMASSSPELHIIARLVMCRRGPERRPPAPFQATNVEAPDCNREATGDRLHGTAHFGTSPASTRAAHHRAGLALRVGFPAFKVITRRQAVEGSLVSANVPPTSS
jgi:hypothetical protein